MLDVRRRTTFGFIALAAGLPPAPYAIAAIASGGDTTVGTSSTDTYVGRDTVGTVAIDAGSQLFDRMSYLGFGIGAAGTATINGTGSKWTSLATNIGYRGNGTVGVEAGAAAVSSSNVNLGLFNGSNGIAKVTGPGSTWTVSSTFYVGRLGTGSLTVADGGQVTAKSMYASLSNLNGNGTIAVNGLVLDAPMLFDSTHGATQTIGFGLGGSLKLTLNGTGDLGAGHQTTGSVRVADGMQITCLNAYLGSGAGASGIGTVSGVGSKWATKVTNDFFIGNAGNGTLTIDAGGTVTTRIGYIGNGAGSNGTLIVRGTGSLWDASQGLYIGQNGDGTLRIESGGKVTNSSCYIGEGNGSNGIALITGTGSAMEVGANLYVGSKGAGSLIVSNGGTVTARTLFGSRANVYGNGSITVEGAVMDGERVFDSTHGAIQTFNFGNGGSLKVTGTGFLGAGYQGEGSLIIRDGVFVSSAFSYLGYQSGSVGTATIHGTNSKWTPGDLRVGYFGRGTLRVDGGANFNGNGPSTWVGSEVGSSGTLTISGPQTICSRQIRGHHSF